MRGIALYIHTPYCKARCRFCNFYVLPGRVDRVDLYFKTLEEELLSYSNILKNRTITSIYFGGGTPSLVDGIYIAKLLDFIRQRYSVDLNVEITLECNPENIDKEKLNTFIKSGINRLSIGLQSWQNNHLKEMGRLHTLEKFLEIYKMATGHGFKNINVDLIFGFPNQTLVDWQETLNGVIDLDPTHISCYSLEVDDRSIWGILKSRGQFKDVSEEVDREMYQLAKTMLRKKGYEHYEVSNWSRPNYKSVHNYNIWQGGDYIGLGASAEGRVGEDRLKNPDSIELYLNNKGRAKTVLDKKRRFMEEVLLGFRLIEGFDLHKVATKYKIDYKALEKKLKELELENLVKFEDGLCKLTDKGLDLENNVVYRILEDLL